MPQILRMDKTINILGSEVPSTFQAYNSQTKKVEQVPTCSIDLYSLQNEGNIAIEISGYVGGYSYWKNSMKRAIMAAKPTDIWLNIDSLGGDFASALSFNDFLSSYCSENKVSLHVRFTGLVASAATFIGSCSQDRAISQNSFGLIHQVSGVKWGNSSAMAKTQRELEKFDEGLLNIYARDMAKGKKNKAEIKAQMEADEFMSPQEFVALGIAHRTFDPHTEPLRSRNSEDTAAHTAGGYWNQKTDLKTKNNTVKDLTKEQEVGLFNRFKNWINSDPGEPKIDEEKLELQNAKAENKRLKDAVANSQKKEEIETIESLKAENNRLKIEAEVKRLKAENAALTAELAQPFKPTIAPDASASADSLENCSSCSSKTAADETNFLADLEDSINTEKQ